MRASLPPNNKKFSQRYTGAKVFSQVLKLFIIEIYFV